MVQSCFAEMLCDFCSYELKNRYENSGGMNNIKDQHAGFVIASLEKENTTTLCRLLISDWAALYRSATNVNECKDLDPGYKYIHDWEDSCPSEYSFPAVSYHVEII